MKTLRNGSKLVNIVKNTNDMFIAMYCQEYNGEQQVLQAKEYSTIARAEKFAKKILGL